jgi:hypothetical protein
VPHVTVTSRCCCGGKAASKPRGSASAYGRKGNAAPRPQKRSRSHGPAGAAGGGGSCGGWHASTRTPPLRTCCCGGGEENAAAEGPGASLCACAAGGAGCVKRTTAWQLPHEAASAPAARTSANTHTHARACVLVRQRRCAHLLVASAPCHSGRTACTARRRRQQTRSAPSPARARHEGTQNELLLRGTRWHHNADVPQTPAAAPSLLART